MTAQINNDLSSDQLINYLAVDLAEKLYSFPLQRDIDFLESALTQYNCVINNAIKK